MKTTKEIAADAKSIAEAGPDLLEACKIALRIIDDECTRLILTDAIAKAEGRAS